VVYAHLRAVSFGKSFLGKEKQVPPSLATKGLPSVWEKILYMKHLSDSNDSSMFTRNVMTHWAVQPRESGGVTVGMGFFLGKASQRRQLWKISSIPRMGGSKGRTPSPQACINMYTSPQRVLGCIGKRAMLFQLEDRPREFDGSLVEKTLTNCHLLYLLQNQVLSGK
jgi:hypothetical protein